jgi:glycosyltransferase involved in cell wall biosynthesis
MASSPTISVVVPAYNVEHLIRETLDTVLAQTRPAHEIVVVDDGSTDGTAEVVEGLGDAVRLVRKENGGCASAFNRAIEESTGDYVALCPADDLWDPSKLEWQAEAIAAHPEIDVSFGHALTFGLMEQAHPRPPGTGVLDNRKLLPALFRHNLIADPTAVVRRELYDRIGFYKLQPAEDYDFWLRALFAGAVFHYEPRLLVRLRWHGGNLSSQALTQGRWRLKTHELYASEVDDEDLVREVLAADLHFIARAHMGLGQLTEARDTFRDSLRRRFSPKTALFAGLLSVPGSHAVIRAAYRGRSRLRQAGRPRLLAGGSEARS